MMATATVVETNSAVHPGVYTLPGNSAVAVKLEEQLSDSEEEIFHDAISEPSSPVDAADGSGLPQEPLTPEQRQQLYERVLALVNFYFGESNYSKDQFLRKQATQDPLGEGWICVDVIASFKKMKKLTEDKEMVLEAMRACPIVTLNADESKIRRREILAKDIEDGLAKTVILGNIPPGWTEDNVRQFATNYGNVNRVRFFTAGRDHPFTDEMKSYCMNEYGDLKTGFRLIPNRLYALVEYSTIKQAGAAAKTLHGERDWRSNIDSSILYRKPKGENSLNASPSLPVSREGSPFTNSNLIVQRARANSLNARLQREKLPNFADLDLENPPERARASSFTADRSGGRWRAMSGPQEYVPSSRSPSQSPQLGRRFITPEQAMARVASAGVRSSNLSHAESPPLWSSVASSPPVPSRAPAARQPAGPNGTRGFLSRVV